MNADLALMEKITCGAVKVEETAGGIRFHRFTEEQRAVFENNDSFHKKTYATSGIYLDFITDAEVLRLRGRAETASTRFFYYFDVSINGILSAHPGYESCDEHSEFDFEIALGGRERKQVTICFPCLSLIELNGLALEGATMVEPVKRRRRILYLGDSITQGYDSRYPSLAYANQLAAMLDAEAINKAIGGDRFNPELAARPDEGKFDLIVTAYGTNDWRHHTREQLWNDSREFFDDLRRAYPEVPVVAILPIWRHNWDLVTEVGTFAEAAQIIRGAAERLGGVTVVDGMKLTPHLKSFYSDGLHPNEFGFMFYTRNLFAELPEELK